MNEKYKSFLLRIVDDLHEVSLKTDRRSHRLKKIIAEFSFSEADYSELKKIILNQ